MSQSLDDAIAALPEPLRKKWRQAAIAQGACSVSPPSPSHIAKAAKALEKEEQAACIKIFRAAGCAVYTTSQYRPSKVSAGIPDLWVVHEGTRRAFWFECKKQSGGVMS